MELLKPIQINKVRKDQTRELVLKNERLSTSLRKVLALQNDINFDADKAKKVADYKVWCNNLQEKMSRELSTFEAYKKLTEDKKEEYYALVAKKDAIEDKILDKKEELEKLKVQVAFTKTILEKSHA